jgi:hypothetical protein
MEETLKPKIVNECLHEIINTNNGVRVINFNISKDLIVKHTMFSNHNFHKFTWTGHLLIERLIIILTIF